MPHFTPAAFPAGSSAHPTPDISASCLYRLEIHRRSHLWVELQMVADNGQQPVQPRVHTGHSAHQPHPLPSFPGSTGPRRFCQLPSPEFRHLLRLQASSPSAPSFCCTPGRCGTTPAAILPPLSTGVCKLLPTPLAGFFYMRLIHRQQTAKTAAVSSASLFPC